MRKRQKYLKKLPETTQIEVGGHTDSDGTDDKNQKLSENRAKSSSRRVVGKYGVNPNMLTEKGYGESRPETGQSKPKSRREVPESANRVFGLEEVSLEFRAWSSA
ncbi:MAG: OmpA family protein [Acidobacteria bacterium]|nr:OmpA family protein [Acidobacteriota bacterium]